MKAKEVLRGHEEKLRLGTTKKAYASLLVKVQPSCNGRPLLVGDASVIARIAAAVA